MIRLLPLLVILAACKAPAVPPRGSPESSVLGIRVNVTTHLDQQRTLQATRVYFALLPEGENALLGATKVYESNFQRGAVSMLLNAEPGRYALVCAVADWEGKDHYVYMPATTVTDSIVEVKAGEYVFIGSLLIKESRSFSKADDVQKRYLGLVRAGPANPSTLQQLFPRAIEFLGEYGSLSRSDKDVERTEEFMRKSLARYGW